MADTNDTNAAIADLKREIAELSGLSLVVTLRSESRLRLSFRALIWPASRKRFSFTRYLSL